MSATCRAPLIAAIPLLHAAGLLTFPLLLVLVFAVGAFGTPSFVSTACSALPPLPAPPTDKTG